MTRLCSVPGCMKSVPGRHAPFCVDHCFEVEPAYLRMIIRMSVQAERAEDEDERRHCREQRESYTRSVIRLKGWGTHAA